MHRRAAPALADGGAGATRTRDAAIVGFSAATQLTLRSGTDNHALTAGLRMSW